MGCSCHCCFRRCCNTRWPFRERSGSWPILDLLWRGTPAWDSKTKRFSMLCNVRLSWLCWNFALLFVPPFNLCALAALRLVGHASPGLLKRSTYERVSRNTRAYHSGQLDDRYTVRADILCTHKELVSLWGRRLVDWPGVGMYTRRRNRE